jgi:hypothetical protein
MAAVDTQRVALPGMAISVSLLLEAARISEGQEKY